ncbi:MAG: DUF4878 domain-containing protein [Proteobacteria bacterium]|jgi:hypothetical protein|nr:DUF4878 domain-containing protein [Pseudomonadota bacterium]
MSRFFAVDTRKLAIFLGAFFAFALLTGCSAKKPEYVVRNYLEAIAENKVAKAAECFALEDATNEDLNALDKKMDQQHSVIKENGGLETLALKFIDKNDDIAHVEIEIKFVNGKTEKSQLTLVKESKKWKIKRDQ